MPAVSEIAVTHAVTTDKFSARYVVTATPASLP
jgi:hypothetical protein